MNEKPLVYIGISPYIEGSLKYIPHNITSLKNCGYGNYRIVVADNSSSEKNENQKYILENYPEIKMYWMGGNIGFGRAYNFMIKKAVEHSAKYFLAINGDAIIEPGALDKMVEEMEKNNQLGSVTPKILRWDFNNNVKTKIIDSCGIKFKSGLRFYDLGQGEDDKGQYDNSEILGPSGAAALFRIDALEQIKENEQYYDELMFMYKEDCDLAYRLFLAGYKSKLVSDALVYHDRTAAGKGESNVQIALNRNNKSEKTKAWSFKHQNIIFMKYWKLQSFSNKISILFYSFKMFVFILFFERYLLKEYGTFLKLRKKIKIYS